MREQANVGKKQFEGFQILMELERQLCRSGAVNPVHQPAVGQ